MQNTYSSGNTELPRYKNTTFRSDMIGVHPRIIINSEISMEEIDRRKSAPAYGELYKRLIGNADSYPADGEWLNHMLGQDLEWRIPDLALAYYYTGNTAYTDKLRAYVFKMLEFERWGKENDGSLQSAATLIAVSMAYDWCYDIFSEGEKQRIKNKLMLQVRRLFEHFQNPRIYWMRDYLLNHRHIRTAGLFMTALALMGEGDDAEIIEYYNYAEKELKNIVYWAPHDGSNHESPAYFVFGAYRVIQMMTAYEGLTGSIIRETGREMETAAMSLPRGRTAWSSM